MNSTAIAIAESRVPDAVLEGVVVGGDLSKLSPSQRLEWYKARCEAAGLDPRTQPFQYLSLQGRLSLYATKSATDQLISNRKLTVAILDRRHDRDLGIFEVHCRVSFPDGHHVEDFAAIAIKGLSGEPLCNALMKTVTKAKRRTVLSACGLGMLDESEVDTIPNATRLELSQDQDGQEAAIPGPGTTLGAVATTKETKRFEARLNAFCGKVNAAWFDRQTGATGEIPSWVKDLANPYQIVNHMLKEAGIELPSGGNFNQCMKAAAKLWLDDEAGTTARWKAYVKGLAEEIEQEHADADPEVGDSGEAGDSSGETELVGAGAEGSGEDG